MDFKIIASTFAAVFIAELGDKTQMATFSLAGGTESRLSVLIGAVLALAATSVIAVLAGSALSQYIPPQYIRKAAGLIFIVLGVIYLTGK